MKKGFTLIEIVVVVSVISVLMITITSVLVNAFRARNRVDVGNRLEQNGNYALMELKNNFMKASGVGMTCVSSDKTKVSFINKNDGQLIVLKCISNGVGLGYKIASTSADLTSKEVVVNDCSNFVSCDTLPSSDGAIGVANFSFVLSTGVPAAGTENYTSRKFETKVVVRN